MVDHKLTNWSRGRRYTLPVVRDHAPGRRRDHLRPPGFQPFAVHDVALANLVPGTGRRPVPEHVADVLRWAEDPLAAGAVAVLVDLDPADARERLGQVAVERRVGSDGFWTLAG